VALFRPSTIIVAKSWMSKAGSPPHRYGQFTPGPMLLDADLEAPGEILADWAGRVVRAPK
jgi:hypothetical protein